MLLIAPAGGIYSRPTQFSGEFDAVVGRLQNSPGQPTEDEPIAGESDSPLVNDPGGSLLAGIEPVPLQSRFGGFVDAGLAGRASIWLNVFELSTSWERLQPDNGIARVLRPIFGYGPDMMRYSTPLVSEPRVSIAGD